MAWVSAGMWKVNVQNVAAYEFSEGTGAKLLVHFVGGEVVEFTGAVAAELKFQLDGATKGDD